MYSTATIDAIRELPIEDVIGKYVDLKKVGANLKACCPLPAHGGEKTPSFNVVPGKQMFKCFGCGAGGDAIQFVIEHEGLNFYEAIAAIAQNHGIQIEQTENIKTPEQKNEEHTALQILQYAQSTYRALLIQ